MVTQFDAHIFDLLRIHSRTKGHLELEFADRSLEVTLSKNDADEAVTALRRAEEALFPGKGRCGVVYDE